MRSKDFRYADLAGITGTAFVLILLFIFNPGWEVMTPAGQIDPYLYTGHMRDLSELKLGLYQGARVPWIFYGHVAYALFDPEAANLALRVSLWLIATGSMYVTVRKLWAQTLPAFGAAALMGIHPYFMDAIRWDYVDAPCIALTPVVFMLIVLSRDARRWPLYIFGAGFFAMTIASMNLTLLSFMPLYGILGLAMGPRGLQRLAQSVPLALAGVLACFFFFGLINHELVGRFNYFQLQIDAARTLDASVYHPKDWEWMKTAWYLTLPAMLLIGSVVVLAIWRKRVPKATLVVGAMYWLVCAAWAAPQFTSGSTLSTPWYVSFLLPFSFLLVGGFLGMGNRLVTVITVIAVVSLGVGLKNIDDRAKFVMVYDLDDAVWKYSENGTLLYWYDITEPYGNVYNGAASLRMWYPVLLSQNFPTLANPVLPQENPVPVGVPIAIVSQKQGVLQQAEQAIAAKDFRFEPVATGVVDNTIAYTIVRALPRGTVVPLDINTFVANGSRSHPPDKLVVGPVPYDGGASLPLPPSSYKEAYVRVRLTVSSGAVDVCILTKDSTACLAQKDIFREGPAEVIMKATDFSKAGFIVVRNSYLSGTGEVSVQELSLIVPDESAP